MRFVCWFANAQLVDSMQEPHRRLAGHTDLFMVLASGVWRFYKATSADEEDETKVFKCIRTYAATPVSGEWWSTQHRHTWLVLHHGLQQAAAK